MLEICGYAGMTLILKMISAIFYFRNHHYTVCVFSCLFVLYIARIIQPMALKSRLWNKFVVLPLTFYITLTKTFIGPGSVPLSVKQG